MGYLKGGVEAWLEAGKEIDSLESISAEELESRMQSSELTVLDVRKPTEYDSDHLTDAENFPLGFISENMNKLDATKEYHVHCAGGYRSVIASSIMKSRGYHNVVDVAGGFASLKQTNLPRTNAVTNWCYAKVRNLSLIGHHI